MYPLLSCLYSDLPLDKDGLECVTRLRFDSMCFKFVCARICLKKERAVLFNPFLFEVPSSVAARSKAWICGLSLASVLCGKVTISASG
jgi:hypothetical protein